MAVTVERLAPTTSERISIIGQYATATDNGYMDVSADDEEIGDDVRAAVEQALTPMKVTWARMSDFALSGTTLPDYEARGPVFTVTRPIIGGDEATITTAYGCGAVCGSGGFLTLTRMDSGNWLITGPTAPQWVS